MTFHPDERGFAELERQLAGAEVAVAEAIADRTRDLAPVATGEYRDGIGVEVVEGETRVVATVPHSAVVELGTADTPAFAPMSQARDAVASELPGILDGWLR